jgi:hypothetical protein
MTEVTVRHRRNHQERAIDILKASEAKQQAKLEALGVLVEQKQLQTDQKMPQVEQISVLTKVGEKTCDSCGKVAELRHVQFANGIEEKVCHGCVETWALEFGGAAMEILNQWDEEMARRNIQ